MSNQVQTQNQYGNRQAAPKPDPNELRRQMEQLGPELRNALPSHIKPEKFQRVVQTIVQLNPGLYAADRRSLLAACLKCAADGLLPDGKEAALVLFGKVVTYMPMIAGILKRMRNSGEIASFQAHVIYERDTFVIKRGLTDILEHEPKFPGDRGKAIGAYAVAKFKDGSDPQFEVMDLAQIEKVKAASKSSGSGPWVQWWDEMARKTVARRLAKWLPMDAETEEFLDRTGKEELGPVEPSGVIDSIVGDSEPASKLDALEDATSIDQSTGEIIEAEKVESGKGSLV